MDWLLIWLFVIVCLVLIASAFRNRSGVYEYPFFAGATFLGFIGPQVPALVDDRFLPADSVTKTLAFTILCAALCGLGWVAGGRPLNRMLRWRLDEGRLIWVAALLSLAGAFFFFKMSRLPDEIRYTTMPSGIITIYLFFSKLTTYGFVIAAFCFAHRASKITLAIMLFDSVFILDRVLVTGKRGELTEFVLGLLLAAFFQRRVAIPRPIILGAALVAGLALSSTSTYREKAKSSDSITWEEVAGIDIIGNFETLVENGGPEMRNAVMRIDMVSHTNAFDFGIFHWNSLVYAFVPAQLVGSRLKDQLIFEQSSQYDLRYASKTVGSTETGMADAFASFWYFGAMKFFLIGYLLSRLYQTALAGWVVPQIIYALSVTPAMISITHFTQWIVSAWFQMAIMLVPLLFLARGDIRWIDTSTRASSPG